MKVSEQAIANAKAGLNIGREKRRAIQKMNSEELTGYLVEVYRSGFEDGATAIADYAGVTDGEVRMDWEDVLKAISEVKGVGAKLLKAINDHIMEVYNG